MIFLDANAFYWYFGREKLFAQPSTPKHDVEKLNGFLDGRTDKRIPASVFMEIIVHFRDDPEKIKKLIRFREEKGITIHNNFRDHCFTPDELTILHLSKANAVLTEYAYKLFCKLLAYCMQIIILKTVLLWMVKQRKDYCHT